MATQQCHCRVASSCRVPSFTRRITFLILRPYTRVIKERHVTLPALYCYRKHPLLSKSITCTLKVKWQGVCFNLLLHGDKTDRERQDHLLWTYAMFVKRSFRHAVLTIGDRKAVCYVSPAFWDAKSTIFVLVWNDPSPQATWTRKADESVFHRHTGTTPRQLGREGHVTILFFFWPFFKTFFFSHQQTE